MMPGHYRAGGSAPYAGRYLEYGAVVRWVSVLSRAAVGPPSTSPVLRYRYEVRGQTYVGFRAAFSGYGVSRAAMQAVIQPYAVGSSVTVYYDPRRPASAVLNNALPSDRLYSLLFGCGFLLLAAYLIL